MDIKQVTAYLLAVMSCGLLIFPAQAINCDRNPDHHQCVGGGEAPGDENQDPVIYLVEFHDLWDGSDGTGILTVHDADRGWADYTERKMAEGCQQQPATWKIEMIREQVTSGKHPDHNILTSQAAFTTLDLVDTGLGWERYWPTDSNGSLDGCFKNGVLVIEFRDTSRKREATTEVKFSWEFEVYADGGTTEFFRMTTDWLTPDTYNGDGAQHQLHWSPDGSDIISINGDFYFSRVVQKNGREISNDPIGSSLFKFWFNTNTSK